VKKKEELVSLYDQLMKKKLEMLKVGEMFHNGLIRKKVKNDKNENNQIEN